MGPTSAGLQPCGEGGGRSLEGPKREPGSGPAWPVQLQDASVVFHNQQACSPGYVLPSPLAPHIPLHTLAAKWHLGPCWGRREANNQTQKTHRYQWSHKLQTQRDNTDPDEAKVPRHKPHTPIQDSHPARQADLFSEAHIIRHATQSIHPMHRHTQADSHVEACVDTEQTPTTMPLPSSPNPLSPHTASLGQALVRKGRKILSFLSPGRQDRS